ncbi:hypothetical protein SGPA1_20108 [Streptomyces misionensis JCM 4497]
MNGPVDIPPPPDHAKQLLRNASERSGTWQNRGSSPPPPS